MAAHPVRQAAGPVQIEGLTGPVIGLLGLALTVPDHTKLCRRAESAGRAVSSSQGKIAASPQAGVTYGGQSVTRQRTQDAAEAGGVCWSGMGGK